MPEVAVKAADEKAVSSAQDKTAAGSPPASRETELQQNIAAFKGRDEPVVKEFVRVATENPTLSIAVAAIQALTSVVKGSTAHTMMGLQMELRAAADLLQECSKTSISLAAGCELFNKYVTRISVDVPDFEACKKRILERGENFAQMSLRSRATISQHVDKFISSDKIILTHGYSRVVISSLLHAAKNGKYFSVIVTEGRPDHQGMRTARELCRAGIPTTMVLDSAVGYVMDKVDLVLLGAEGVVENGGIINKIGTFQIAVVAKSFNRPVYVAAESYKFARLYPLNQTDLPESKDEQQPLKPMGCEFPPGLKVDNPSCDYTSPSFVSLIFTDLGIFTPSAVSDELIKLYY
eukprot:g27695.t1